jgi:hypothetical protein
MKRKIGTKMAYPIPQNLIRDCSTTTQNIHGASRAENTMTMDEKKKNTGMARSRANRTSRKSDGAQLAKN